MIEKFNIRIPRFNIDVPIQFIWVTYFPFIGWFYPFIYKKDDAFAMHHAKQAFIMAVFFTAVPVAITFLTVFVPISWRAVKLVSATLVYLSHVSYFFLSVLGYMKIRDAVRYEFPIVSRYAQKLEI